MPESPSPFELFEFGLRVAWHACGCDSKQNTAGGTIVGALHALTDIASGSLTLRESGAENRNDARHVIERLRQENDEVAKGWIEQFEKSIIDSENECRDKIAEDQRLALLIQKS